MTPRYRLTEQAQEDVLEIWHYIAQDNADAADRVVDEFTAAYKSLSSTPRIGMDLNRLRTGLRAYPVGKYVVFFRPIEDGIEVYRVLHGSRDWRTLLSEAGE